MSERQYTQVEIIDLAEFGCIAMNSIFKGRRVSYDTFSEFLGILSNDRGERPLPRSIRDKVLEQMAARDNALGRKLACSRIVSVDKSKPKDEYGKPSSGFTRNISSRDLEKFRDLDSCIEYHQGELISLEIL